jgi:hypothetical protein
VCAGGSYCRIETASPRFCNNLNGCMSNEIINTILREQSVKLGNLEFCKGDRVNGNAKIRFRGLDLG